MAQIRNKFAVLETLEPEGEINEAQTLHNAPTLMTQHTISLTKVYFRLIQITHHIQIISSALITQSHPKGMKRQVIKLSQFIKPACPNILQQISHNTNQWMDLNMRCLLDHYNEMQLNLLQETTNFVQSDWERACKWAHNRFKHKLQPQTLTKVKELISSVNPSVQVDAASSPTPLITFTAPSSPFFPSISKKQVGTTGGPRAVFHSSRSTSALQI